MHDDRLQVNPKKSSWPYVILNSTIDPTATKSLQQGATEHGYKYVDAPVSGGIGGAEAGTLTFMVGGTDAAFSSSSEVLQHMGKNIVHCGDAGTGQVAKLCNNLLLGISMAGVSEAMHLGKVLGIDSKVLAHILNTSTGRCWSSDTYNPVPGVLENVPSSNEYKGGFATALMLKDLGLVTKAADDSSVQLPLGQKTQELYQDIVNNDLGDRDFSVVYQYLTQHNKHK